MTCQKLNNVMHSFLSGAAPIKSAQKIWAIMGVVLALAILGLIFIKNYSTVFCWVAIVAVVLYYLGRKYGLEWYVKRKMNEFPVQEIKGIRLGVQPHGIVMRQQMGLQEGVGTIGWKNIYEWYNTPDFYFGQFQSKRSKRPRTTRCLYPT